MTTNTLAIIGGTGLSELTGLIIARKEEVETPFGLPSAPLVHGTLFNHPVVFLARHGETHEIPPHQINYRGNLWALKACGVQNTLAVTAVGGIHTEITPTRLIFPDQIIDYTYSRAQTFYDGSDNTVTHIDFTYPYCESLRKHLIQAASKAGLDAYESGTYAALQGPRLETAAEIDRLERDGCDMVGMTGMPEASLAKELGLCYATCAICANFAAGRGGDQLNLEEMYRTLEVGMKKFRRLLRELMKLI
jgi:5'-methylthioinosine phosphorylase